jgi:hypothetical protein
MRLRSGKLKLEPSYKTVRFRESWNSCVQILISGYAHLHYKLMNTPLSHVISIPVQVL